MAIRNSSFLMSGDPGAADALDVWGSLDGWWSIANLGLDLGSDGQSSDVPPPRVGGIPPINVEDPPLGRVVDVPSLEPDPSLDRPSSSVPNPPSGNADSLPTSDGGPPLDRITGVPSTEPVGLPDRPGLPDPPAVDANNRPTSAGGAPAESTNGPLRETAVSSSPTGLAGNTIYFRSDGRPGNSDDSLPSGGADWRVDPSSVWNHGNADLNLGDTWAAFIDRAGQHDADATAPPQPTAWQAAIQAALLPAMSEDAGLQIMLAGAWHL